MYRYKARFWIDGKSGYMIYVYADNNSDAMRAARAETAAMYPGARISNITVSKV